MNPKVTIIVPNYKTLQLTKLCLNLLRKYTPPELAQVIVVDNDSQDESTEYLRSLAWIQLLERTSELDETPPLAHSRALDLALTKVRTPYVLVIHTDTLVKHSKWLHFLLAQIESKPKVAGIGSWKLENKNWLERFLKNLEDQIKLAMYKLMGKKEHKIAGTGKNHYYLRSHCALYRMDLIRKYNLTFSMENETAGKALHRALIAAGYEMIFLPSVILSKYIDHVNHATTVLSLENIEMNRTLRKTYKRLQKAFAEFDEH